MSIEPSPEMNYAEAADTLPSGAPAVDPIVDCPDCAESAEWCPRCGYAGTIFPSGAPAVEIPPRKLGHVEVTGGVVERVRTRLTESVISTALDLGHVGAFNVSATSARLSVAWAMVCQETGRGQSLWCWNFGNIDAAQGWTGDRFSLTANEGHGATLHAQTKYLRAYPDAFSGAVGWWRYLAAHHATALQAFSTGDGEAAAVALKASGYYTGSVDVYRRALRLMAAEWHRRKADGSL